MFIAEWLCRAEGVAKMGAGTQACPQVRFKSFELDLKIGELSQRGEKSGFMVMREQMKSMRSRWSPEHLTRNGEGTAGKGLVAIMKRD